MTSVLCLNPVVVRLNEPLYRMPQGLAGPSSVQVLHEVVEDFSAFWAPILVGR